MSRITPVHWKVLKCIFEKDGFVHNRTEGDHIVLVKPKVSRPIIIPKYSEIDVNIIKSNMRTAKMSRDKYLKLLKDCK